MDEDAILSAKQLGIMQHEAFVADRIINSKLPITNTLTRNNLHLFHRKRIQNHFLNSNTQKR